MSLAHAVAAWTGHALVVWSDAGLAFYHPGHQDWEQVELTGNMQQLNWWQRGLSVDSGQLILWGKSHHGPWRLARYHLNHQQWEDWELEAAATNTAIWSGDELWLFRAQTESTLTR